MRMKKSGMKNNHKKNIIIGSSCSIFISNDFFISFFQSAIFHSGTRPVFHSNAHWQWLQGNERDLLIKIKKRK
jgi:hypothetical protein